MKFTLGNQILLLSCLSWFIAQCTKGILQKITEGVFSLQRCLASGGMPSSHSALVTCCATTTGLLYGFDSGMFAIAAILAIVVMYDACNVRRQSGEQAKAINLILKDWQENKQPITPELLNLHVKVLLGHTPLQVICGAILGLCIGIIGVNLL